tara:strand:- start:15404 stop:15817 length:414 start_codon:yes stop_codon:yes gene_type:complete
MDLLGQGIKNVTKDLKSYIEARMELLVLNGSEKATQILGQTVQQLFVISIVMIGLLFTLLGLGFYLGELLESNAYGFFLIGAITLFFGILLLIFKPKGIAQKVQAQFMEEILAGLEDQNTEVESPKFLPTTKKEEVS